MEALAAFVKAIPEVDPKGRFYTVLVRQADGSGAGTIFQCTGCRCCRGTASNEALRRSAGLVSRNPAGAPKHVAAEAPRAAS